MSNTQDKKASEVYAVKIKEYLKEKDVESIKKETSREIFL